MTRASDLARLIGAGATINDGTTITTADNTSQLILTSTDADSSIGPVLELARDSASPADGDAIGQVKFTADNDAGEATGYATITGTLRDASDGTEDAQVQYNAMVGGSSVDFMRYGVGGDAEIGVIFNEGSIDADFRVESNGQSHLLFVDGGNDCLLINNSTRNNLGVVELLTTIGVDNAMIIKTPESGVSGTATEIKFRYSGSTSGTISYDGSSTSYATSSDYRLKENVTYDFDATTRLKQLKPARFNFITDADNTVDGFIAHEVSSIVPEAITGEKDAVDDDGNIVPQSIDQSKLVPLLVKTIQELEARIATLESK